VAQSPGKRIISVNVSNQSLRKSNQGSLFVIARGRHSQSQETKHKSTHAHRRNKGNDTKANTRENCSDLEKQLASHGRKIAITGKSKLDLHLTKPLSNQKADGSNRNFHVRPPSKSATSEKQQQYIRLHANESNMKEIHDITTRLECSPPCISGIILGTNLSQLSQLTLKPFHILAVNQFLREPVVNQHIHIDRVIIKCTVPAHTVEEGLQLPRVERVCLADAQGKHSLESRMTKS